MADSPPPLLVHVVASCPPERFAALGQALLAAAERPAAAARLLIAELTGDAVLLGRFQRAASAVHVERLDAAPLRRSGGGRAISCGGGTIGVLLALPVAGHFLPGPVGADKLLNRYLRGLIAGLGVRYFGRDYLSADRRQVAIVSQDGAAGGAQLVEAVVGVTRTLALPPGVHAYPPHPDPRAAGPPFVSLAELGGRAPTLDEIAERLAAGHARVYRCAPERRDLDVDLDGAAVLPVAVENDDEAGLLRSGPLPVPIGFVESLARADGSRLLRARLRGDFIAPAFAVAGLEASLGDCPLAPGEVGLRVDAAFRPPATIIGVTDLGVIARVILAAGAA